MQIENEVALDFCDVSIKPKRTKAVSRADVELTRTYRFLNSKTTWTGIPLMAANMDSVASFDMARTLGRYQVVTCLHKYYSPEQIIDFFNRESERITQHVYYTMGMKSEDMDKLRFVMGRVDLEKFHNICCDVANGYSEKFVEFVQRVRGHIPQATIIAGNVCTPEMVQELLISGAADIVKVGIGSGACCLTRVVAGVGVPQLTAVIECADSAHGNDGHVISDGGCREPGDVGKAFAAGADFVMLGSMLAGHDECGGEWVTEDGQKKMILYGMSSEIANEKYNGGLANYRASEGRCVKVPYKGSVLKTLQRILGGIRSTCAYVGTKQLKHLSRCTTFVRVNRTYNDYYEQKTPSESTDD